MTVGCLVVRDVAGCRRSNLRDVPSVQPLALWSVQWSVELLDEVLGQLTIVVKESPNDHKYPQVSASWRAKAALFACQSAELGSDPLGCADNVRKMSYGRGRRTCTLVRPNCHLPGST
jgi:hypothetical protein